MSRQPKTGAKSVGGIRIKTGVRYDQYYELPKGYPGLIKAACNAALIRRGINPKGDWLPLEGPNK